MNIIFLHSAMVAASRDLLASLGVTIPEGDDVTVTVGSDTVRIISKHALAVAAVPAFPGYPVAAVTVDGKQHVIAFPATWEEVTAWAGNPVPAVAKSTVMSQIAFFKRFTPTERIAIRQAATTDTEVFDAMDMLNRTPEPDLKDPLLVECMHLLLSKGLLTQDRATAILTP